MKEMLLEQSFGHERACLLSFILFPGSYLDNIVQWINEIGLSFVVHMTQQ